jgi:DNA repair protein RecO (recombination protein O)
MERTFRAEAVVLYHWDYGEADRMVGLYTLEHGKLNALVKGARKARSRKAGHMEPFTRVSLMLAHGHSLNIITQADTLDAYLPLRENLEGVAYASCVVELIDKFAYEGEENRALFSLLTNTLQRLCKTEDAPLVLRYFEIRLLDLLGFRPKLFQCAVCQKEIQAEDQYFSAEAGGVLCPNCGRGKSGTRPISLHTLRYLRHLQRSSFSEVNKYSPLEETHREMENLMLHYITHLLERNLNTPGFLRKMKELSF